MATLTAQDIRELLAAHESFIRAGINAASCGTAWDWTKLNKARERFEEIETNFYDTYVR